MQQADIVFLVDGSGSIGAANFAKLENFVKGIVGKLDVGANKVHVGLMQFSNYPSKEFPLNMYSSRQDVMTGKYNLFLFKYIWVRNEWLVFIHLFCLFIYLLSSPPVFIKYYIIKKKAKMSETEIKQHIQKHMTDYSYQ